MLVLTRKLWTDGQQRTVSDHNSSLSTPCSGELKIKVSGYRVRLTNLLQNSLTWPVTSVRFYQPVRIFVDFWDWVGYNGPHLVRGKLIINLKCYEPGVTRKQKPATNDNN